VMTLETLTIALIGSYKDIINLVARATGGLN
jgi:hypothetical protein